MATYILRRLLWMVVLLLVISAVTFLIFYALPSADPAALRAGRQANPELIATIRHNLGLDEPIYVQYYRYMKAVVLHFDFGYSYQNNASVRVQIVDRLPATISLTVGAVIVWLLIGLPVGIISAVKRHSLIDRLAMGATLLAISAPVYWLGLVMLYLFANDIGQVKIFEGAGSYVPLSQDVGQWFGSLLLPWLVLAAAFAAFYARLMRSSLSDVLHDDYIRTARAKGLSERSVVLRHGVRAAITPIVTVLGLDIGILLGGAVLTESVFNVPGIGRLAYDAIQHADFAVIQGTVLFAAFFIIVANLIVDIAYAFIDPRVRY